jgi:hypothetical protein
VGVGEGELLDGAIHEVDVFSICPCRLSLLYHSRSGVHPDKLGIWELLDHTADELPGPASHIENRFDGPGIDGGFAHGRFLHWPEEQALQNRAVIVRRPAIEVGDVSILCHSRQCVGRRPALQGHRTGTRPYRGPRSRPHPGCADPIGTSEEAAHPVITPWGDSKGPLAPTGQRSHSRTQLSMIGSVCSLSAARHALQARMLIVR